MFHTALSNLNPSPLLCLKTHRTHLKPAQTSSHKIYKVGKARPQKRSLCLSSYFCLFLCPQSASNHVLFCVDKCAPLIYWAGSKYLGRRRRRGPSEHREEVGGDEEREEEDYANVSKQLRSYPETERRKGKGKNTSRKRQEDRQTQRRNKLNHMVRNKWESLW